ncbi:MAG: hypothetical protein U0Y68_00440 [Blastocatellia bacterium]
MNKEKKHSPNGNGVKAARKGAKQRMEFLPLVPVAELKKKKTLTPEEALMLAWHDTYSKRHKRLT